MVVAMSGYQTLKQQEKEREERKAQAGQWPADHFVSFPKGDNTPIRLRFLYNMRSDDGYEMVAYQMHDYFVPGGGKNGNGLFVRALCAKPFGKECKLCAVADEAIAKAKVLPEGVRKKEAIKEAYQKAAQYHYILPCFQYEPVVLDEIDERTGKNKVKNNLVPKLLDLRRSILDTLMQDYDKGIELDDGNRIEKDITCGDYIYRKTGSTKEDTRYTIAFRSYAPAKLAKPSLEKVEEMILECRPYQVLGEGETGGELADGGRYADVDAEEREEYAAAF